jgi:hypothetical protein
MLGVQLLMDWWIYCFVQRGMLFIFGVNWNIMLLTHLKNFEKVEEFKYLGTTKTKILYTKNLRAD